MTYLRKVLAVVGKDVRAEFRSKETLSTMLVFALLVVVIFSFAFDPTRETVRDVFPGILWVAFYFAGMLGLNRSFAIENRGDCLHGLMLCPSDRSVIFFGKVAGNLLFMLIMEAVSLPVFFVLFDYGLKGSLPLLLLTMLLGTFGFIAVGTFLAALAANTRACEILLPLILFPVAVPAVIAAVKATSGILAADPAQTWFWLRTLVVYDLVFLIVPFLLFDYVLEV